MPNGVYQERRALIDRIQLFESSARRFDEDWRARMVDGAGRHIAYAKARLAYINDIISNRETSAHA
jgi:hypothetical protein